MFSFSATQKNFVTKCLVLLSVCFHTALFSLFKSNSGLFFPLGAVHRCRCEHSHHSGADENIHRDPLEEVSVMS